MKKTITFLLVGLIVIPFLIWWFRFDVYCYQRSSCVAYDRVLGKWLSPFDTIKYQDDMRTIEKLKILSGQTDFDISEALAGGHTYDGIIDHLREEYIKKQGDKK